MNARPTLSALDPAARYDWNSIAADLDARGCAVLDALLTPAQCRALAALYDDDSRFRSRVIMARHGFGRGEYKYLSYPLPEPIAALRTALYPRLAPIANEWNARMGIAARYPDTHQEFLTLCHDAGQARPTPLLLRYDPGDYNCLHQDLYGDLAFPLQATILLSQPGEDFTGGEFVLTEQRPRMQSRPEVVPLRQGDAVLFPCITGRLRARAAAIASICATASAACARDGGTRRVSSSTMRVDGNREERACSFVTCLEFLLLRRHARTCCGHPRLASALNERHGWPGRQGVYARL